MEAVNAAIRGQTIAAQQGVELIELAKDVTLEQIQAATGVEFYKTLVA